MKPGAEIEDWEGTTYRVLEVDGEDLVVEVTYSAGSLTVGDVTEILTEDVKAVLR